MARTNTIATFSRRNFQSICDELANRDASLGSVLRQHGYPPFWVRPNTFETLVLTILEQQVSLASAYAAYKKLKVQIDPITSDALLALTDEDLRACYFSRQKIVYVRGLAGAIQSGAINLAGMERLPNEEVHIRLKELKGIGDWTVDIYLIHALRRTDIFPLGDLALVNSLKQLLSLPAGTTKENLLLIAEPWRPYRSLATMILWHHYIQTRGIKLLH
jgi:DNA-3-methyladenine glycosylase II